MSVGVMTVGVLSVGEITVGVMTVGVMRRPHNVMQIIFCLLVPILCPQQSSLTLMISLDVKPFDIFYFICCKESMVKYRQQSTH